MDYDIKVLENLDNSNRHLREMNTFGVKHHYLNKAKRKNEFFKDSEYSFESLANRGLSYNIMMMDNLIRTEPSLQNAINYKSVMLLSNGYDLNISDKTTDEKNRAIEVKKRIKQKHNKSLMDFVALGVSHGGAGALIVVDNNIDKKRMLTPLTEKEVKKGSEISLRPLTRLIQVVPDYSRVDRWISKVGKEEGIYSGTELGKPKYYRVSISGSLATKQQDNSYEFGTNSNDFDSFLVHRSRLFIYNSSEISWIERQLEQYFGISLPAKAIKELTEYKKVKNEIIKLIGRSNIPVYKMNLGGSGIKNDYAIDKIESNIASIELSQEIGGTVAIDSKEEFQYIQADFNHLKDIEMLRKKDLASAYKVPLSVAFNEKDENDEERYYFDLENIQERQLRPALEHLIRLEYKSIFGEEIKDFSFDFKSFIKMDELDKARKLEIAVRIIAELVKLNIVDYETAHDMLISASDNINDMLYEINKNFADKFKDMGTTYNDLQKELAITLNRQQNNENGTYNMSESKVKGELYGGDKITKKKPTIDLK